MYINTESNKEKETKLNTQANQQLFGNWMNTHTKLVSKLDESLYQISDARTSFSLFLLKKKTSVKHSPSNTKIKTKFYDILK